MERDGNYSFQERGKRWEEIHERPGNWSPVARVELALSLFRLTGLDVMVDLLPPLTDLLVSGRNMASWGLADVESPALRDIAEMAWLSFQYCQTAKCRWRDGSVTAEAEVHRFLLCASFLLFCCRQYQLSSIVAEKSLQLSQVGF